jgi:hypothetical protein
VHYVGFTLIIILLVIKAALEMSTAHYRRITKNKRANSQNQLLQCHCLIMRADVTTVQHEMYTLARIATEAQNTLHIAACNCDSVTAVCEVLGWNLSRDTGCPNK